MQPTQNKLPGACPRCGSTHFQLANVAQYVVSPGVQPQLYSNPIQVIMCLCGHPSPVNRRDLRTEEQRSLQASIAAARQYHEGRDGQIKADLERDLITHTDFQALSERVSALETMLEQMGKKDTK